MAEKDLEQMKRELEQKYEEYNRILKERAQEEQPAVQQPQIPSAPQAPAPKKDVIRIKIPDFKLPKFGSKTPGHEAQRTKENDISLPVVALLIVAAVIIGFNQYQISSITGFSIAGISFGGGGSGSLRQIEFSGDPTQDALAVVISTGTPFYGEELGVSFDDPINSLAVLASLDPAYGSNKITPQGANWDRYIKIDTTPTVACEFCCSVKTAVRPDGSPTCGCKHSWAIRGLTAYLVENYPELSDEEIIAEIAKWKALFFPKNMVQRFLEQSQTGQYTPDIAGLLLDVDTSKLDLKGNPDVQSAVQDISNLPGMVGGC